MSNKFEIYLSEPIEFSDNTIVIMAEWNTPETFFEKVNEAIENDEFNSYDNKFENKEEFINNVKEDFVHFHIRGDDDEFWNKPAWWLWCKWMKSSKKVLTYY